MGRFPHIDIWAKTKRRVLDSTCVALLLPEPMLSRSGDLPTRPGWSFEPKWDGFRAILRTGEGYCVRTRRGWPMTELLPEFATLPVRGVFDGELVAFGTDGLPRFTGSPCAS
jgi:bifunctional non-homologous end joining protein LigD